MQKNSQQVIEKLRSKLASANGQVGHLNVRNLELHMACERLALAIENHRLNTTTATQVDQALWEELDNTVVFK